MRVGVMLVLGTAISALGAYQPEVKTKGTVSDAQVAVFDGASGRYIRGAAASNAVSLAQLQAVSNAYVAADSVMSNALWAGGIGGIVFGDAEGDPAALGVTAGDGSSTNCSRRDHVHPQTGMATDGELGTASNTVRSFAGALTLDNVCDNNPMTDQDIIVRGAGATNRMTCSGVTFNGASRMDWEIRAMLGGVYSMAYDATGGNSLLRRSYADTRYVEEGQASSIASNMLNWATMPAGLQNGDDEGGGTVQPITNFTMAVDSKDWQGWEAAEGSTAANALVFTGYSTPAAADNSLNGWAAFSSEAALQDKYAYAFVKPINNGVVAGITVLIRSSSTDSAQNKVNILFDDGSSTCATNTLVSGSAGAWTAFPVTVAGIPAGWKTGTGPQVSLGGVLVQGFNARADFFAKSSNYIQCKVVVDWD